MARAAMRYARSAASPERCRRSDVAIRVLFAIERPWGLLACHDVFAKRYAATRHTFRDVRVAQQRGNGRR